MIVPNLSLPKVLLPLLLMTLALASSPRQAVMGDMIDDENYMLINPAAAFEYGSFAKVEFGNTDLNSEWAMVNYVLNDKWAFGVNYGRQYESYESILFKPEGFELKTDRGLGIIIASNHRFPVGLEFYTASQEQNGLDVTTIHSVKQNVYSLTGGIQTDGFSFNIGYLQDHYAFTINYGDSSGNRTVGKTCSHWNSSVRFVTDIGESDSLYVSTGVVLTALEEEQDLRVHGFDFSACYYGKLVNRISTTAMLKLKGERYIDDDNLFEAYRIKIPQMTIGFEIPVIEGDNLSIVSRAGCQISYAQTEWDMFWACADCFPPGPENSFITDDDYIALGLGAEWKGLQFDMSLDDELVWQTALSYNF